MLFGTDRRQMRAFFFEAWRKYRSQRPLEGAETLIVTVAMKHPEYHSILESPETADHDWQPEQGQSNPFLHMAMHIAIEEQVSTDRPTGIRDCYQRLCTKTGDEHTAQHLAMDCLGTMLWTAGRNGRPPDESQYLTCLEQAIGDS